MANIQYSAILMVLMSSCAIAAQDPTAPLGGRTSNAGAVSSVATALPELQSIVCQQACYATLNQQVLSTGDEIDGYRVELVSEEQVTLTKGQQTWQLQLFSLDIKE
ncbi:MSHA biogenesis protein MshK [Vibrio metschnikovii]|uniref:MSHA biogenesis protein MshK n=1 Tax=Vibrio metschnikovii TaxID=28172 RepID=UPI0030C65F40